jgi:hypothetical protein
VKHRDIPAEAIGGMRKPRACRIGTLENLIGKLKQIEIGFHESLLQSLHLPVCTERRLDDALAETAAWAFHGIKETEHIFPL